MKRDTDCKGCSWNFGRPDFPCSFCKDHDLYIDFPYHKSEDEAIQKRVIGLLSATIFTLIGYALGLGSEEVKKENASVQQEDNPTNGV